MIWECFDKGTDGLVLALIANLETFHMSLSLCTISLCA
jgi:hypothetical protein